MAKLYFYYASMNAGKSTTLLQADFNYRERGMTTMLFTAAIDDRFATGTITSRLEVSAAATPFDRATDIAAIVAERHAHEKVACVLVDEAQFLTGAQVDQLAHLADVVGIPVLAYGLRTDFQGQLFEGSARLLALADALVEIKSVCECGRKATMNLRVDEQGRAVAHGAQTEIGGNDRYVAMCRKHFVAAIEDPGMNPGNPVYQIAVWLIPLVIAIVFHEVAHGYVARLLGDRTAEQSGRLTLNPIRHVDPVGTVVVPMVLALAHAPIFGWAKPVPVVAAQMRHPRRDMALVALAGPVTNLILATIAAIVIGVVASWNGGGLPSGGMAGFVNQNLVNFLLINVFLAIFNLLPVPPFDGGHVVEAALPRPLAAQYARLRPFAFPVMIVLLVVLPSIAPGADVVARVVYPIADAIIRVLLGIFSGAG